MIEYKGQLNLGNEAFGTEKTITANESVRTCDTSALAREIAHGSHDLIPESVAKMVLENFCKAAVEKIAEGFAIQLMNGEDVALRIFPDIHVKGGNINLTRAKELDPTVTELTLENAGSLIDKAGGVTVRVRATAMPKFTELLESEDIKVQRTGIVEVPYRARQNGDNTGGDNGNGDNGNGDDDEDMN